MIPLFVTALAFGGVLVGVSALLGGDGGHEVDKDIDAAADDAPDGDAEVGEAEVGEAEAVDHATEAVAHAAEDGGALVLRAPWASLRFWSFGSAAFGATGLLLTLGGFGEAAATALASGTGAAVGWAAAALFRALRTDQVSGDVRLDRLRGAEGVVTLPVRPGGHGRVRVDTAAGVVELTARTRDGRELGVGARVLLTRVDGDVADVTGIRG